MLSPNTQHSKSSQLSAVSQPFSVSVLGSRFSVLGTWNTWNSHLGFQTQFFWRHSDPARAIELDEYVVIATTLSVFKTENAREQKSCLRCRRQLRKQ